MPWTRIDDGFSENPKTLRMKGWDTELGAYMAALCYASRRRDPHITPEALRVIGARPRTAERLVELGLWDQNGDGWVIHDWHQYQGPMTAAERVSRHRRRNDGGNDE